MDLSRSRHVFNAEKAKVSLVGAIVVNTNDVGFYAFRANSRDVLKSHRVTVKDADTARAGWSEQDPRAILRAVQECVTNTTTPGGMVLGVQVVAVGIANHRGSVVAWNRRTGVPLCNALLWSDNRAAAMVDEYLRTNDKYRFQAVCGLPFSPFFAAFKVKWLLVNDAEVTAAYRTGDCYFGTIDTWLLWNLTGGTNGGVFATDATNASHTFLMNINTLKWDEQLLKFFGISEKYLPAIKTSSEVYGNISEGFLSGIPISGVIGNRQAALIAHKCFRRGLTKAILDKSGSIFTITGEEKVFSKNGLLTTIAYRLDSRPIFALEGPIASAGNTIEWAKKCLNIRESQCLTLQAEDRSKNEVYLVPAFNGLYAPHWRNEARSVIVGANEHTVNENILKAAMESVSFQTQDIVEALNDDLKMSIGKIQMNGDLSDDKLIMQHLSDITNSQVEVANFKHLTALGAAMAAGYAPEINIWNALCMPADCGFSYHPQMSIDERKHRLFDWKRAMRRSYDWVDYDDRFHHFWAIASITSAVILFGGYLYLKK